jgi:hypothetical protein
LKTILFILKVVLRIEKINWTMTRTSNI